ncbi:hypothetical protein BCR44DRAFT_185769 [Catenaria anguillulae PL171]|uniref:Uncharacterized protein n=1 Tax=Catenaria anguillulae PL171 TaxID=765915 RepID=A0A1Y2HCL6_9FUNG|nr:hypothetical protein BCR44DRAFT_185769 [Catenaria anguillulae PL171]
MYKQGVESPKACRHRPITDRNIHGCRRSAGRVTDCVWLGSGRAKACGRMDSPKCRLERTFAVYLSCLSCLYSLEEEGPDFLLRENVPGKNAGMIESPLRATRSRRRNRKQD